MVTYPAKTLTGGLPVLPMILPELYVGPTEEMGRGVFTSVDIARDTVIETSPVIVLSMAERKLLDQTLLHDYIFEWGDDRRSCCMALGYVPLYNHSYRSNCEYEMDFDRQLISIKSVRFIKAGEEIFINYNGDWNNTKPVWFDRGR
jgi:SET domain-containing protein